MANRYSLPPRWLNCPRKSTLIADTFVAIKTPLDSNYKDKMEPGEFWTPSIALQSFKSHNIDVGLWIDLTNTSRFYNKEIVVKKNVKYVKIECRGHGECPSPDQTRTFIAICNGFIAREPSKKILVHCTHGYNRTGFLICAYLIEKLDWSVLAAVNKFAECRSPGIYKGDYLKELFQRYGDVEDAPNPPELPDWCNEEDDGEDDESFNNLDNSESSSLVGRRREPIRSNAVFMAGVSGVVAADTRVWSEIQRKCQDMCEWKGRGFPGSQPVSLDWHNMQMLRKKPYLVSWKADGTRYMMLIDGKDRIFFIDRDNSVYQAKGVSFPSRKDPDRHLTDTLLDGEMIIDEHDGQKFPRYLIYDIVKFQGVDVNKADFGVRRKCIKIEIIEPREEAKRAGTIDRTKEPFGIRLKEFWDIKMTRNLFGPSFTKNLSHEIDGLIFQPLYDPYKAGQCLESLKWKPPSHNSIDFKLVIKQVDKPGELPHKACLLYVNRFMEPFAQMKYTKELKDHHNKIIECTWDYAKNAWKFMRIRTDKSFPNAYQTAMSVMDTIKNPITKERLLDFIEQIPSHLPPPNHHHHSNQGLKRPYPQDSHEDRNLMPPPLNYDKQKSKVV